MWICGQPARSRRLPTSPHRDNDDDDNNYTIDLPVDAYYTQLHSQVGWRASKEPRKLVQRMGSTSDKGEHPTSRRQSAEIALARKRLKEWQQRQRQP